MPDSATNIESQIVEEALTVIFESVAFRSSKQCQVLLRYIVEQSLAQHGELLRERVIGASVFGRAPDYDTGNDPVVRARVAEIRKRLAQYYLEHRGEASLEITIPRGSYRAIFLPGKQKSKEDDTTEVSVPNQRVKMPIAVSKPLVTNELPIESIDLPSQPAASRPVAHFGRVAWVAVLTLGVFLISGVAFQYWHRQESKRSFEQFWEPLMQNSKPALIYIGSNYTYRFSHEYVAEYRATHHLQNAFGEFFVNLQPDERIAQKDLRPFRNLICFSDVAATGRIVSTLSAFQKKYDLRYGDDVTITDLRSSPDIFIGGFSNPWALQLTQGLRYTLEHEGRIVDNADKSKEWHLSDGAPHTDYAIVSRLFRSKTGNFVLAIAGISGPSNQAAAEFISDPVQMNRLLKNAPAGWDKRNMQIVLRTQTINDIPTSTDILAVHFW